MANIHGLDVQQVHHQPILRLFAQENFIQRKDQIEVFSTTSHYNAKRSTGDLFITAK